MKTYIVQVEVDEEKIREIYKDMGAPKTEIAELVKSELESSELVKVIKIEKVNA